jgi:glycosyltransferase involved in cell wall biosynthesis
MKIKICELCLSPDLGGLELYMLRAMRYLGKKESCVAVINETGKLKGQFEKESLPYTTLKRHNMLLLWSSARQFAHFIDQEEIDLIHVHWTKDLPIAVMAKLLSKRKPAIVQTRHMRMTRFKNDVYHRFLYKNIDLIIAITQQVQKQLKKFIPNDIRPKVELLYSGAEVPTQLGIEEKRSQRRRWELGDAFTVGIVGRIEKTKGQHLVLGAVKQLFDEGIDTKALIVGHAMDEEYLTQLKEQYASVGIFTGFTKEAQSMMQLCDVIVLATDNETFGLVLVEAMMSGVCVVASDSGGPLEIIDDGITGLLFKTSDQSDLTDILRVLAHHPHRRIAFSTAAKHKAMESFEANKQFEQLRIKLVATVASRLHPTVIAE